MATSSSASSVPSHCSSSLHHHHTALHLHTSPSTLQLGLSHDVLNSGLSNQCASFSGSRILVKETLFSENHGSLRLRKGVRRAVVAVVAEKVSNAEPLRVMISGAPASGKGTQSQLIVQKYGLVHISPGDLLRAEVAACTDYGKKAKKYMDQGQLVPDDIVVTMVKERLAQPDVKKKGWLLDGYPRSRTQAEALEALGIRPHVFVLLDVEGNETKNKVFESIERLLTATPRGHSKDSWRGIPTRLNSIPHTREIREYFYRDVCEATKRAVEDGIDKLKVQIVIPELNPDMDVYRIGTLLELMRELAFSFANDGKRVKVCVQGSMGEGIFTGMPLQLAGTRRILEAMDWGSYGAKGTFINIGAIGAKEVEAEDDLFLLMAPQNSVGTCIINDLQEMVQAAGRRPLIIVNPMLKDLPASGGVMQVSGREGRMKFANSFFTCYKFRLLYLSGTLYPILGALRMKYPLPYELYKRTEDDDGKERYVMVATFKDEPTSSEIGDAFSGQLGRKDEAAGGFWSFLRALVGS